MTGTQGATVKWTYPLSLLALFGVAFIALGIAPWYREDWLLENLLAFAALAFLIATHRSLRFTNLSYTLLFAFLLFHEIGAHYTYSLVPYDSWLTQLSGATLAERFGLERNHYDRLIHFLYGLLVLRPTIELLDKVAPPRGIWRTVIPFSFILSHSALYELLEWATAMIFGGDLGTAYLGTQGDEWDSQKDMACAASGAILALMVVGLGRRWRRKSPS